VKAMAARMKTALIDQVERLQSMEIDDLVERRYARLMSYGISS
jgi:acetyl-CoA carboxylase carboxyl transferase subunit alpha